MTDVVEAANGREAVELFKVHEPDLVLTDWNMPEMTGLEVVQELRKLGSQIPIIMITTEAQQRQVIAAIQAGCTDYLTKPFEADFLREKLDKYNTV